MPFQLIFNGGVCSSDSGQFEYIFISQQLPYFCIDFLQSMNVL